MVSRVGPEEAHRVMGDPLDGFDGATGLYRAAGNARLYRKLIVIFSQRADEIVAEIDGSLVDDNLARARYLLHQLKGMAGNVSATNVYAAAVQLEEQVVAGAADPELLDVVRHHLEDVHATARRLMSKPPPETGGDAPPP